MTAPRDLRLERLLGALVVDAHGYPVGVIEDVVAQPTGDEYVVTQVVLGPHRWLARLLASAHQLPTLRALGVGRRTRIRRVPWTWLDLCDPQHPKLVPTVISGD